MIYFPPEIMRYIYEFDNTYKIVFDKVLNELIAINNHYYLYIHNYMFHCDINYIVGLEYHNIFYFLKKRFKKIKII